MQVRDGTDGVPDISLLCCWANLLFQMFPAVALVANILPNTYSNHIGSFHCAHVDFISAEQAPARGECLQHAQTSANALSCPS